MWFKQLYIITHRGGNHGSQYIEMIEIMQMYTLKKSTEESYELKRLLFGLFLTHFAPFHFFHMQKENQKIHFWLGFIYFFQCVDDSGYLVNIANNSANLMILVLQKVRKVKVLSWEYIFSREYMIVSSYVCFSVPMTYARWSTNRRDTFIVK